MPESTLPTPEQWEQIKWAMSELCDLLGDVPFDEFEDAFQALADLVLGPRLPSEQDEEQA